MNETNEPPEWINDIKLVWENELPVDKKEDIIQKTIEDIKKSLIDLKIPSDLIFHIVCLTSDWEGPTVTVYGSDNEKDDNFYCHYDEETVWETKDINSEHTSIDKVLIKDIQEKANKQLGDIKDWEIIDE